MTVAITPADLFLSEVDDNRAMATITTVIARAARFAPCILQPVSEDVAAAMKGILVDVVVRRYQAHAQQPGIAETKALGDRSHSIDTKGAPTALFQPSEITELQLLCAQASSVPVSAAAPAYSFPDAQPWPDGLCSPRWRW